TSEMVIDTGLYVHRRGDGIENSQKITNVLICGLSGRNPGSVVVVCDVPLPGRPYAMNPKPDPENIDHLTAIVASSGTFEATTRRPRSSQVGRFGGSVVGLPGGKVSIKLSYFDRRWNGDDDRSSLYPISIPVQPSI